LRAGSTSTAAATAAVPAAASTAASATAVEVEAEAATSARATTPDFIVSGAMFVEKKVEEDADVRGGLTGAPLLKNNSSASTLWTVSKLSGFASSSYRTMQGSVEHPNARAMSRFAGEELTSKYNQVS